MILYHYDYLLLIPSMPIQWSGSNVADNIPNLELDKTNALTGALKCHPFRKILQTNQQQTDIGASISKSTGLIDQYL